MKTELTKLQIRHSSVMGEMQLHLRLAKTLEDLLRKEFSHLEECINEMESCSVELLRLQKEEQLQEEELQKTI